MSYRPPNSKFTTLTVSSTLGVTGVATFTAAPIFSSTTASQTLEVNGSKQLTSVAITGTGNYVKNTSPTLLTPILGTPTSGVLTNCTGLPLTSGVTGTLPVANGGTGVTASTGSGSVVFNTSPTLVIPAIGTPSSGVLTNCTGLPLTSGVTGTLPIANGGTNGTSATAGFDNLSPTTTKGDLILSNGTNNVRVAVGADGQFLKADSTASSGVSYASVSNTLSVNSLGDAGYTITDADGYDVIIVGKSADMTAGRTVTLPTAADNSSRRITVTKGDSAAFDVTIDGEGAEVVGPGGATTLTLSKEGDHATLLCDGTEWRPIAGGLASTSQAGMVSTGTQSFSGEKHFDTNVGIGLTSPDNILHIAVPSGLGSSSISNVRARAAIVIKPKSASGSGMAIGGSSANDAATLQGVYNDNSTTTAISLNPYGDNVGIGTTTPGAKLDISDNTADYSVKIDNTNSGGSGLSVDTSSTSDGDSALKVTSNNGSTVLAQLDADGELGFGGGPAANFRMIVKGQGATSGTSCFRAENSSGTGIFQGRNDGNFFTNSGSVDGSLSDARLKTNIQPITNALSTLCALNPVQFDWKVPEAHVNPTQAGFIAQEVQQVREDWVQLGNLSEAEKNYIPEGDTPLTTKFADMQAYLIKAIQELKVENDELKDRLDKAGL